MQTLADINSEDIEKDDEYSRIDISEEEADAFKKGEAVCEQH